MKKNLIVGVSIILAGFAAWVYEAFKFEQDISNKYLPILEKYKENVSYESIEVDKFKFKITINKIKLVSKTKLLSFYSDQLIIKKIPYANRMYIDSYGGQRKTALSEDVLYAPDHHISVVINKPIFGKAKEDLSVDIQNNKFMLFDAKNDMQILNLDNYNLNIKHISENKDTYALHINSVGKNVRLGAVFEQFFIVEVFKLFPHLENLSNAEQHHSQDYYYLYKFDELTKDAMSNAEITVTYPKELLKEINELVNSEQPDASNSIMDKIFKKDINVSVVTEHKDNLYSGISNLKLSNSEHFKLDFATNYDYDYNSEHKSKMIELFSDYYQKIANRDLNKFLSKGGEPVVFSEEDFTKLFTPLLNIRNLNLAGSFDYSKNDGEFSHMLECKVNNFGFKFHGKTDNSLYIGELSVNRPRDLLKFIANYASEGLQPIVKRIEDEKISDQFVRIVKTLDEFGLAALNVLSINDITQEPHIFLMNFKSSKSLQNIMVNNKDATTLLNNEKIQTFLQNLTPPESLDKNN